MSGRLLVTTLDDLRPVLADVLREILPDALRVAQKAATRDGLLSLRAAAKHVHRAEAAMRAAVEANEIPGAVFRSAKPGRRQGWLIPLAALEAWALADAGKRA